MFCLQYFYEEVEYAKSISARQRLIYLLSLLLCTAGDTSPAESLRPRAVGLVLALAQRISPAAHARTVGAVNKVGADTGTWLSFMAGEEKDERSCNRHRRQNAENSPGSTACAALQPQVIPHCESPASGDVLT